MKNRIYKTLATISIFFVIIFILQIISRAAGDFSISASKKELNVGEQATISITLNNAAGKFNVKSSNNNVSITTQPDFGDKNTVTAQIKANSVGKSTITIIPTDVADYDGNEIKSSKTIEIQVKDNTTNNNQNNDNQNNNNNNNNNDDEKNLKTENKPVTTAKSQDNSLKALSVNVGTLSPKFSSRTTKYTVDVGEDVTSIKISATKNHSGAKISGTGTKQLQPGKNTFNIDVKAENGSTQTYVVTVNKPEVPQDEPEEQPDELSQIELKLASLFIKSINTDREIADVQLTPEFSAETYNYNIDVEENIESLTVEALPKEDGTIVEITGNENLVSGENIITIVLKSADGEQTATYKILVNKKVVSEEENGTVEVSGEITTGADFIGKYCIPIVVGTGVIAILGIIFAVIEYNHGKKDQNKVKDLEYINYDISLDDEKKPSKKEKSDINKKEKGKHF